MVLLHGWALNSRFWDDIAAHFAARYCVICFDLPGHGKSDPLCDAPYILQNLAAQLTPLLKPNSVLVGWSLGGMIAMHIAATQPQLVSKLIVTASSPQFFNSSDWQHGIEPDVIQLFADDLIKDYHATIKRFLAIQAMGSVAIKEQIKHLREKVYLNGEPAIQALTDGLTILLTQNMRDTVRDIHCPSLIVLGEKDTLIPVGSGDVFTRMLRQGKLHVIKDAAHAPFISHAKEFINVCEHFLYAE